MSNPEITASGGCLCQAVRYEILGPLRDVVACHCIQCRRTSGHFVAATATRPENLIITEDGGLRWYRPPGLNKRGFCIYCGSSLFFEPESGDRISIATGTLDSSFGLKLSAHIFIEEAGNYYDISDDAVQVIGGQHDIHMPEG